eukprot:365485-Chlamydomonas_euryale.AAC.6
MSIRSGTADPCPRSCATAGMGAGARGETSAAALRWHHSHGHRLALKADAKEATDASLSPAQS